VIAAAGLGAWLKQAIGRQTQSAHSNLLRSILLFKRCSELVELGLQQMFLKVNARKLRLLDFKTSFELSRGRFQPLILLEDVVGIARQALILEGQIRVDKAEVRHVDV
jgi:hypothetical protein